MSTTEEHPSQARMRDALRGAAAGLDLQAPGPESVRRTAHHRVRRQQRVTAGIASVAVVAGGVGIARMANREPGVELQPNAVGNSPSGITFTWADGEQVLANQPQIVQGADGVLYALSTAPGVKHEDISDGSALPQAIYTSTDGIAWQATELDPGLQLASLDVRDDGVLYGLSTAPGTADVRVATSADGGASWQLDDLPAAGPQPTVADGVELEGNGSRMDIAVHAGTTVVTVQRYWWVQPDGLVSPEEIEEDEHVWLEPTDEGLEVHGQVFDESVAVPSATPPEPTVSPFPTPAHDATAADVAAAPADATQPSPEPIATPDAVRVLRTIPWAEIGLDGRQDLVVSDTFTAVEGGGWTPVSLPVDGATAQIEATGEGFVAILHDLNTHPEQATTLRVARSTDGLDWTLDEAPMGEAVYVSDVGTIGDRIVVAAVSSVTVAEPNWIETYVVSSSGDAGRTWTVTDLAALPPPVEDGDAYFVAASDIGPLGVAAVLSPSDFTTGDPGEITLVYSPDGVAWDIVPGRQLDEDMQHVRWLSVHADRIIASVLRSDESTRTVVGIPTR